MAYQPIVIIGAPRSGTNMLRDMLTRLPGVGTWPCDEINYIWRHNNVRYPSDEFSPSMASNSVRRYVRRKFDWIAKKQNLDTVIEKTCANSLRVGFVDRIVPDAKYVFVVRDGVDVVGSAFKRWRASLDLEYVLRKARYVPLADVPYYGTRYLFNHIHRSLSKNKRLAIWGPRLNNIDELLDRFTLLQVCAIQWQACVQSAERDIAQIPCDRIIRVKYEEVVRDPLCEFGKLAGFLGKDLAPEVKELLAKTVSSSSIGKGRKDLDEEHIDSVLPLIKNTLNDHGYA